MPLALLALVLGLGGAACAGPTSASAGGGQPANLSASPSAVPQRVSLAQPAPTLEVPRAEPLLLPADRAEAAGGIAGASRPRMVIAPILLYHHVRAGAPPVRYTISTQRFEQQLDFLIAHGYHTITMQDLQNAIEVGAALPERPVMLTFDDGNRDVLDQAFPLMQARGMVGVMYVVAKHIGAEGFLSAEDVKALRTAGWEIGSHGLTHASLEDLKGDDLAEEVARSKEIIEAALGEPIHSFAFPFGIVTDDSLLAVIRAGYTSGAGLGLVNTHRPDRVFYLSRREVHGTFELASFEALLEPQ